MMHGHEKSRSAIVAVKPTNKVVRPAAEQSAVEPAAAEPVERRAEAEGNAGQQSTHRAQYRVRVAQTLACIRQAFAVVTRGGNRMRESCKYGSVRGAPSNGCPYRDRREFLACSAARRQRGRSRRARSSRTGCVASAFSWPRPRMTWNRQARVAAFLQGLKQLGWADGRNVRIDTRWATTDADDIRRHATELVALAPDVILDSGGSVAGPLLQARSILAGTFLCSWGLRSCSALHPAWC